MLNFDVPQPANAYITGVPTSNPYTSYTFAPGQLVPTTILGPDPSSGSATVSPQMTPCVPQTVQMPQQQKLPQPDRIEVSSNTATIIKLKLRVNYFVAVSNAHFKLKN